MSTRLLQITDLHILPEGERLQGVDTFAALERVLGDAMCKEPEVVIATGDLAERGDATSYLRLREVLVGLGLPVIALPGNHDRVEQMATSLLGGRVVGLGSHDLGTWRLLALDTTNPERAWGRLSEDDLDQIASSVRPTVVAQHHGPRAHCHGHKCRLQNEAEQMERLAQSHVRAVISGHLHQPSDEEVDGVRLLCTPATCIQVEHPVTGHVREPGQGYRILDLHDDGTLTTQVHLLE